MSDKFRLTEEQHKELHQIMTSYFGKGRVKMAVGFPTFDDEGNMVQGLEVACSSLKSKSELKVLVAHLLQMLIDSDEKGETKEQRLRVTEEKRFCQ